MKRYTLIGLTVAAASLVAWTPATAQNLDQILNAEKSSNRTLAQAQDQIDTVSSQTDDIVQQFKIVIEENANLRTYNSQVSAQIAQQNKDIDLINAQIGGITQTRREVLPLIQDMITTLRDFVMADIPFKQEDRLERVEALQDLMDKPDVPQSELYRLVMERYKTEAEYGQTIDAWNGTADIDGDTQQVRYVNIGRVAYLFQTQAADRSFVWDNSEGSRGWVELDSGYNSAIDRVIQMAEKAIQPELVSIPVFAPEEAN